MPRTFVTNCESTFAECRKILGDRGGQYDKHADTWHIDNFKAPCLEMALRLIGDHPRAALELRTLEAAALLDQKIQRIAGDYKSDTFVDLINYAADLDHDMRALKAKYGISQTESEKLNGESGVIPFPLNANTHLPAGIELPMGVTASDIQKLKQGDWRPTDEAPTGISFRVRIKSHHEGEPSHYYASAHKLGYRCWEGGLYEGTDIMVFDPSEYDANSGRAIGEKQ